MKNQMTLTLVALAAVSLKLSAATSALPAPLPEFMDDAQAAKWSADKTASAQNTSSEPSAQFYTGKPYVADAGGYLFKYRTYNPEMSRWTSADPGGFPDGANNKAYAPIPTSDVDPLGLEVSDPSSTVTLTAGQAATSLVLPNQTTPFVYKWTGVTPSFQSILDTVAAGLSVNATATSVYNTTTAMWGTATSAVGGSNQAPSGSPPITADVNYLGTLYNGAAGNDTVTFKVTAGTPTLNASKSTAYDPVNHIPAVGVFDIVLTISWTESAKVASGTQNWTIAGGSSLTKTVEVSITE